MSANNPQNYLKDPLLYKTHKGKGDLFNNWEYFTHNEVNSKLSISPAVDMKQDLREFLLTLFIKLQSNVDDWRIYNELILVLNMFNDEIKNNLLETLYSSIEEAHSRDLKLNELLNSNETLIKKDFFKHV